MVSFSRPKSIIFDLDGTLINSAPDIAGAFNTTMVSMGHAPLDVGYVERFIGKGSRTLIENIFVDQNIGHSDKIIENALKDYTKNYRAIPVKHTHFFPHVQQDLATLKNAGLRLGICTNKPHELTALVLDKLGIKNCFDAFFGADAVAHCKPHANHLQTVMQHMKCDNTNTFYVGDTEVDQQCAKSAGTPFFVVPWGGGCDVQEGHKINRLADLLNYFE